MLLLFIAPVVLPIIAWLLWPKKVTGQECAITVCIMLVIVGIFYGLSKNMLLSDTQVLNGKVIEKNRKHGQYTERYSCNCRTTYSGSGKSRRSHTKCKTCTREHYTVKWDARTTVGWVTFDYMDRTSRSVYSTPDPQAYVDCKPDDPASVTASFDNYVRASQMSLWTGKQKEGEQALPYPMPYNFYQMNRVIGGPNSKLNHYLNLALRDLGPKKRVNIVVVFTDKGREYKDELQRQWYSGKKNDVVVVLKVNGVSEIKWADAFAYGNSKGNESLAVHLRDDLQALPGYNPDEVAQVIVDNIQLFYTLPNMEDYKYLEEDIDPPTWVIVILVLLSVGGTGGLVYVMYRVD